MQLLLWTAAGRAVAVATGCRGRYSTGYDPQQVLGDVLRATAFVGVSAVSSSVNVFVLRHEG